MGSLNTQGIFFPDVAYSGYDVASEMFWTNKTWTLIYGKEPRSIYCQTLIHLMLSRSFNSDESLIDAFLLLELKWGRPTA
jgi:hypothetical protein